MRTHAALLRGINVGGRNKLAMKDLKELVGGLGHKEVETYIQSGNVVFSASGGGKEKGTRLEVELERVMASERGLACAVVVVSREELAGVVAGNPFPGFEDPRHLHAVFRSARSGPVDQSALQAAVDRAGARAPDHRDRVAVGGGRTIYLWTPDGFGRSELAAQLSRSVASEGTARNWATVLKLMDLLGDSPA